MRRLLVLLLALTACSVDSDDGGSGVDDDAGESPSPVSCGEYWTCRATAIGVPYAGTAATCSDEVGIEVEDCADDGDGYAFISMQTGSVMGEASIVLSHEGGDILVLAGVCDGWARLPISGSDVKAEIMVGLAGRWEIDVTCSNDSESVEHHGTATVTDADLANGAGVDASI